LIEILALIRKTMGLFDKILGNRGNEGSASTSNIEWAALTSMEQLDEIVALSNELPVVIFKHSTRCGISSMVLNSFERDFNLPQEEVKLYFLDLIKFRDISNEIAERFSVWHESPQLLLIKNGEVVYHNSHSGISSEKLKDFIE
jgi:bacillithiol system protein YtxJ